MDRRRAHPLFGALNIEEARVEERIRTLALCVMGLAVLGGILSYLRAMLVPLVLASATRYLLAFPVDLLTRRPMHCFGAELCGAPSHAPDAPWLVRCASDCLCRLVLPRWLAVLATLCVAGSICGWIGVVVFDSVRTFAARADTYSEQVGWVVLFRILLAVSRGFGTQTPPQPCDRRVRRLLPQPGPGNHQGIFSPPTPGVTGSSDVAACPASATRS